jgi:parallel beta-helix repeat protein
MELTNRIRAVLLVLAVLGSALTAGYVMSIASRPEGRKPYQLVRHLPISIEDPKDFTPPNSTTGCACVVNGSGTSKDPYVIAGWDINASETNGISVRSVDVYFAISKVSISGTQDHDGILVEQVQNGIISDSTINGTFVAISVRSSKNVTIVGNTVSKSNTGLWLEASNFNTVVRNALHGVGGISIFVRGSDNLVEDNRVDETYGAINLDGTAGPVNRNLIRNNKISRADAYGIVLWRALSNTITANLVTEGGMYGIILTDSSNYNTIDNNEVTQNGGDGIAISAGCSNNLVQRNVSKGNGDGANWFDLHSDDPNNRWVSNIFGTKRPDTLE